MSAFSGLPKSDTLLQCADDLRLRRDENGRISINLAEGPAWHGELHAVDILSVFARPTTFADGLRQLACRAVSGVDWACRAETVRTLIMAGILVESARRVAQIEAGTPTFDGAPLHIRMLNDRVRTSRLVDAIRAEVRPGDVVVEVGTGTGVLAVAAARAGARRVYAIEAGAMAPVARDLVRANGVADRVTIIEGWSHAVTLPERGDVFVSETIGNAGFDENLVEIARDAAKRLLKPGARMIPRRLQLRGLPVEMPEAWLSAQTFRSETVGRWKEWYGIDFSLLAELDPTAGAQRGALGMEKADAKILGLPIDLAEAEFFPMWRTALSGSSVVEIATEGTWNALRLFFEAELSPGIKLSTDPRPLPVVEKPDHWGNPVWLAGARPAVRGQRWQVDFTALERGRYDLKISAAAGAQ